MPLIMLHHQGCAFRLDRFACWPLWLLINALLPIAAQAQSITPASDGTASVVTQQGNQFNITGGSVSSDGANLFQSFTRFGLTENQIANFSANPTIQNILGRVVGGDVSVINGLIQVTGSNANLFLMNPAGIVFGAKARLDIPAAFTATTANGIGWGNQWFSTIGSNDYAPLNGTPNTFAFLTAQPGAIANLGNLTVNPGQSLTLLGGTVLNTGILTAPGGTVTLTAVPGENLARLSQTGSLLSLEFQPIANANSAPLLTVLPNLSTATLPALLTGGNLGSATGITVNPNGTIQLSGSDVPIPTGVGTAIGAGQINVAGQIGGNVNVLGKQVALVNANVNALGNAGGGNVRIGGDYQGQGSVPKAQSTYVSQNSLIQADALTTGNGGQVIVWADGTTRFLGSITARGGSTSGNGGLVETSGKTALAVPTARVDASAPQGTSGSWLLDPTDITILMSGGGTLVNGVFDPIMSSILQSSTIETALDSGTSVTITTASGGGGNGDITLSSNINQLGGGTASLTLTGRRFIAAGGTINLTSTGNLTFNLNQVAPLAMQNIDSIQGALDAIGTVAGSRIINLGAGTYTLAGTSTIDFINKSVTINGAGAANTIITGNNQAQVVNIFGSSTVTLNQLTIQDGDAPLGGGGIGLSLGATLNLINSTITNNVGGGITMSGGTTVRLLNSTVTNNTTSAEGGGIHNFVGTLEVTNSTIANNTANTNGGGISSNGTLSVVNSNISNNAANAANGFGGGISANNFTITNSTIANNTAASGGGIDHFAGIATVTGSTLTNNSANNGGGIHIERGTITLNNTILRDNSSTGIEIMNGGTANLTNQSAIIGGTTGLLVSDTGNLGTLGNTRFVGQTGNYIALNTQTSQVIDATAASFDGVTGATATLPQLFTVTGKIFDGLNREGSGLVRLKANNLFVPVGRSIQAAFNVAAAGDTINLAGGTYSEPTLITAFKPLNLLVAGDLTLNSDLSTNKALAITSATGSLILANIATLGADLRLQGTVVTTGDLDLRDTENNNNGGNLTVIARDRITTGFIQTSSRDGNGGNVLLDPTGDIQVTAINATGSLSGGRGGNVTIATNNFFRAVSSFTDPNGINASISTTGGLVGGSINILTNTTGTPTPFEVGNASTNGTFAAITTGLGNQLLPARSIQGIFTQGGPPSDMRITTGVGNPTQPPFKEIQQERAKSPQPPAPPAPAVTVATTKPTTQETALTDEFASYLELAEIPRVVSLPETQDILRQVERETGVRPALIYVNFVPQPAVVEANKTKQTGITIKNVDQLELLVVTATEKPIFRRVAVSRSEILRLAKQFRNEVADPSKTFTRSYLPTARLLYNALVAPIAADLHSQGITNLAFIMDSGLRFIPVAALHDGQQFLVEKYSIGLMPSLSLTDTRIVDLKQAQVLGAGAAQFTDQNPLPAVALELAAIQRSWVGKSLLNDRFTRQNLKQSRQAQPFGIVHLSTHGEFLPGELANSYIQLQDQKLRLNQIRDMGWNDPPVDLLVLSACRMALGDADNHAELGFAGFAVQAGVRSAIASLWNVSDEGTAGLMAEFYRQLRQAPIKAEALRKAQLAMLKGEVRLQAKQLVWSGGTADLPPELRDLDDHDLSHPYYWSAFTLIGSPW